VTISQCTFVNHFTYNGVGGGIYSGGGTLTSWTAASKTMAQSVICIRMAVARHWH
jgi:hypothetical protein